MASHISDAALSTGGVDQKPTSSISVSIIRRGDGIPGYAYIVAGERIGRLLEVRW